MLMQDKTDTEVLEIVNRIMDNLMDASTRIDHEQHTRDFTERLRAIVTQEYLSKVCRQYQTEKGFFADREPPERLAAAERRILPDRGRRPRRLLKERLR
jgi:hypothetical protein